jgi:hypothetical protein
LTNACYDEIKIAWLGEVKRGDNAMVDSEIDELFWMDHSS